MESSRKFTNRLINETSPYLLQHAHNPVDWYAWSDEAFEKAIIYSSGKLNNPITRVRGYQGKDENWNGDFDKAKAKMKKYSIGMDPKAMKLFEQLLVECKKSQIKLVFVYTPEYIEGQKFVQDRQSVIKTLYCGG